MQISSFTYSWIFINTFYFTYCFGKKSIKQLGSIAVLDLFVFYFQNILGNLVSYFLEMIIF